MSHVLHLPLSVRVTKKKNKHFILNLNHYRNTHFQTLNKAKIVFLEMMTSQIQALPVLGRIAITYTLYPRTRQLQDVSNVCSIADKFFCDALVELERLKDDNYTVVLGTQYLFGSVDPGNPRVEARIHPQPST